MKLNAYSPSDNPMEELLFCFGGDDGGGGDGGGGGSSHPGRPGGESGERGSPSGGGGDNDRGGDGSDRDAGRSGPSAGDPGTNAGNIGVGSGAGLGASSDGQDRGGYDPGFDAGDTGDTGRGSDRSSMTSPEDAADVSFPQAPDFSSPSLSDQDLGFDLGDVGDTVDIDVFDPGFDAGDTGAVDNVSFAVAPPPSISGEITNIDEAAIQDVQDRNVVRGATDITSGIQTGTEARDTVIDPSAPFAGEGLLSPEERARLDAEIAAKDAEIAEINARFNALSTPAPEVGPGQTLSSVEMQNRLATAGGYSTRPSTPGKSVLSVGGREYSFDNTVPADQRSYTEITPGIGGVTGALDVFDEFDPVDALTPGQEVAPTADITITGGQPAFDFTRDVLGVDQSIPQMSLAPESRPAQYDRQARMGEVQGPMSMAPVDQTRFSGQDMMRQADDVLDQRAIDEAVFGDPSDMPIATVRAGMEIVNALESTFGGNQARKIADVANRPGGALVRDPRSGEVLGAVGPEENIRSAFAGPQDAVYVGDPRGYEQGVEVGTSVLGPNTNVRAVPTQDPFGGGMEGEPGIDYSQPPEAQRDGGDSTQAPPEVVPPDPETKVCPAGYSPDGNGNCVYQGRDVVGATEYTPMGPVNITYTGLPSLAPRTLRPTSPNLDFLTRSQTAQRGTRTQAPGPNGTVVNVPTYGDIRDARQFSRSTPVRMGRPQGIAGLTKS